MSTSTITRNPLVAGGIALGVGVAALIGVGVATAAPANAAVDNFRVDNGPRGLSGSVAVRTNGGTRVTIPEGQFISGPVFASGTAKDVYAGAGYCVDEIVTRDGVRVAQKQHGKNVYGSLPSQLAGAVYSGGQIRSDLGVYAC